MQDLPLIMMSCIVYLIVSALLIVLELVYFRIADRFNIIDKPNERSSHSSVVLRGGGIIFVFAMWVWSACYGFEYPWILAAVTLAAGISFVDDIHSLPDAARLGVQFAAMGLLVWQLFAASPESVVALSPLWVKVLFVLATLVVCVGATNIYNFMDGINGITAGYSLVVLLPLLLLDLKYEFISDSLILVVIIADFVFAFFNFRPRGKARCFAGDVGSVGMAFILLFCIGMLIMKTGDLTWLMLLSVYGIDGCATIVHRIMLHEKLGEAHRKHLYQIMANELGISHVIVSLVYMAVQLAISLVMVYLVPDNILAHWIYVVVVLACLIAVYVWFMRRYYHLHAEYLESLKA